MKLFEFIAFSGKLFKMTMSVSRHEVRMGTDYYEFKIGFFSELHGIQEKIVRKKKKSYNMKRIQQ